MKQVARLMAFLLFVSLFLGGSEFGEATPPSPPFTINFEPVTFPTGSGPVDLRLQIRPIWDCDKATVTVASIKKLEYSGPMSWVAQFGDDTTHLAVLHVVVPPNDTSSIEIQVEAYGHWNHAFVYFVTTGDTVEVTPGNPRGHIKPPPPPKSDDPIRDTLTEEQLQTE